MLATSQSLPTYAGNLSIDAAWKKIEEIEAALLIDVRTVEEWNNIGVTDLSSIKKSTAFLSWRTLPDMEINPQFLEQITANIPDRSTTLLLICKSGGRSAEAAQRLAEQGYTQCFNVLGGFEGSTDNTGWKDSLPCGQFQQEGA